MPIGLLRWSQILRKERLSASRLEFLKRYPKENIFEIQENIPHSEWKSWRSRDYWPIPYHYLVYLSKIGISQTTVKCLKTQSSSKVLLNLHNCPKKSWTALNVEDKSTLPFRMFSILSQMCFIAISADW